MAARLERAAGDRHHLPPRLAREPRGDEAARFDRRLDHQRPACQPGDDPVAAGEMAAARFGARRLFGQQQPFAGDPLLQIGVLRRIGNVDPAGDHADSVREGALMRGAVDPARQPRDHGEPRLGQPAGEIARQLDRRRAGVARTDHGDAGPRGQREVAAPGEDRRRAVELAEQHGVIGLVVEQVFRACRAHRLDLALDRLGGDGAIGAPAAPAQIGQRLERLQSAAEALQQHGIADRADIGRAQQPDAGESLVLRQGRGRRAGHPPAVSLLPPTRGSSPLASRAIFSRWR